MLSEAAWGGIGVGALASAQLTSGFTVNMLDCDICKELSSTASTQLLSKRTC